MQSVQDTLNDDKVSNWMTKVYRMYTVVLAQRSHWIDFEEWHYVKYQSIFVVIKTTSLGNVVLRAMLHHSSTRVTSL